MDLHNQGKPSLRMKTIILLILSAFTAFAATTYPVLTDNPLRTFSGGGTNLALLNASQTWTGTPTFPAVVLSSNSIIFRHLYSITTNAFFPSVAATTIDLVTNNGNYQNLTPWLELDMPPLLTSNSMVSFAFQYERTNVNGFTAFAVFYMGTNTNFVGNFGQFATTVGRAYGAPPGNMMFENDASFTNQLVATTVFSISPQSDTSVFNHGTNFTDTSIPWKLRVGLYTTTAAYTNLLVRSFTVTETLRPPNR